MRISHVEVVGADASLSSYATSAMQGSYLGIIPRDSIFFFPEERIRADILAAHRDVAAVSISRDGFTGISVKTNDRVPIARWCISPDQDCYFFDTGGFIYEPASSSTQPVNSFFIYEALAASTSPIGSTLPNSNKFPAVFDFARQLVTLGSPVVQVVVRVDEVDDYLASGTRITYVLGHEQNAFTALVSAQGNMNLSDGSVEYVDLRFDGKVYLKKK